jgi:anti-sigma regulatory factor (Ser/Thr protein kinase)
LLATGEAAANAIEHAYRQSTPGDVVIEIEDTPEELIVSVSDDGRWVAPQADTTRGRGLQIIQVLSTDVTVRATDSGTQVRFAAPKSGQPAPL